MLLRINFQGKMASNLPDICKIRLRNTAKEKQENVIEFVSYIFTYMLSTGMHAPEGIIHLRYKPYFPESYPFLPPDTHTHVCILRG